MKITKTIDVSHLTDEQIAAFLKGDTNQKKVDDARMVIERAIKTLRMGRDIGYFTQTGVEIADAVEKFAKDRGIL